MDRSASAVTLVFAVSESFEWSGSFVEESTDAVSVGRQGRSGGRKDRRGEDEEPGGKAACAARCHHLGRPGCVGGPVPPGSFLVGEPTHPASPAREGHPNRRTGGRRATVGR